MSELIDRPYFRDNENGDEIKASLSEMVKHEPEWVMSRFRYMESMINKQTEIVKAVAHIGVDFGYGPYGVEDKHIQAARDIMK